MPTASSQPSLYGIPESGAPTLNAQQCNTCSSVIFPPQPYGCVTCGAHGEAISALTLSTTGTLHSCVKFHKFGAILAEIQLDGGPYIRIQVKSSDPSQLTTGARMRGCLVPSRDPNALELCFTPLNDQDA